MKTNHLFKIALSLALLLVSRPISAETDLAKKLSGRILLQVETRGQAWYVNPYDLKRYYLGRPDDAFNLMRRLGVGITNANLVKLPIIGQSNADKTFAKSQAGKIFLQVQGAGECWYVNPINFFRYYLGRPSDAFSLMRSLALGIRDTDINKIPLGYLSVLSTPPSQPDITPTPSDEARQTIDNAASAIRSGDTAKTTAYFTPEIKKLVEYTMSVLDSDGRLSLGNMISATELKTSTDAEKTYSTEVYVGIVGRKVEVIFRVKKQTDGSWLIANL